MTQPPSQIGPYSIIREIGRGGMGVVYLARDAKLDREVAVKALPDDLAADPDRLSRFEREAKLLASLSHANIASVHGLEHVERRIFLIMEYVDGEELAARLDRGAMPLDEALPAAVQIAAALEAAHSKGVIHRDLKPANIRITPEGAIKVLDFGLAKVVGEAPSSIAGRAASPTIVSPTMPGVILGTAGYLSPEQARGRAVDRRTDVFSFGCVLYEMLTGRGPFPGETSTDSIGAVLHREPDWSLLPRETPEAVRRLLRRCLTKDQSKRLRDLGDARLELEEAIASPELPAQSTSSQRASRLWPTALVVAAAGAGLAGWFLSSRSRPAPQAPETPVARLSLAIPQEPRDARNFRLSPDGRTLAYLATLSSGPQAGRFHIVVRPVDSFDIRALPGTEGAYAFCFSPDSTSIAFTSRASDTSVRTSLMTMRLAGGPPVQVYERTERGLLDNPAWLDSGDIAVRQGVDGSEIAVVSSAGGTPRVLWDTTKVNILERCESLSALPGSAWILCTLPRVDARGWKQTTGAISTTTGEYRTILDDGAFARLLPPDRLAYSQGTALFARAFDPVKAEVSGPPIPLLSGLRAAQGYSSNLWDVSADGRTLVYVPGTDASARRHLSLIDFTGTVKPLSKITGPMESFALASPDGKLVAGTTVAEAGTYELFVYDIAADSLRRVPIRGDAFAPAWMADNRRIIYAVRSPDDAARVEVRRVDAADNPSILYDGGATGDFIFPASVSPDGRWVICTAWKRSPSKGFLVALSLESPNEVRTLFESAHELSNPALSPDGRWIAYEEQQTQERRLILRPNPLATTPAADAPVIVSSAGGSGPMWAPDGSSLIFTEGRGRTRAVTVRTEPVLTLSEARDLFDWSIINEASHRHNIMPDGKSIAFVEMSEEEARVSHVNIIMNWPRELQPGPAR